jgi:hypothetical protein
MVSWKRTLEGHTEVGLKKIRFKGSKWKKLIRVRIYNVRYGIKAVKLLDSAVRKLFS